MEEKRDVVHAVTAHGHTEGYQAVLNILKSGKSGCLASLNIQHNIINHRSRQVRTAYDKAKAQI
jgi:late competence protein required for DNA uptake (superfamily II DNA/RNA helicase)